MNGLCHCHCKQLDVQGGKQNSFLDFSTERAVAPIDAGKATPNKGRGRPLKHPSEESIPHGGKRAVIAASVADVHFDVGTWPNPSADQKCCRVCQA